MELDSLKDFYDVISLLMNNIKYVEENSFHGIVMQEGNQNNNLNMSEESQNNKKLLKFLEVTSYRERYFHNSIWETEKHFTWWISIIFGIIGLVGLAESIELKWKSMLISFISIFGIFLCWTAYKVLRKEGEYFLQAVELYKSVSESLNLKDIITFQENSKAKQYLYPGDVMKPPNKCFQNLLKMQDLGIRDHFQMLFIVSAFVFFFIIFIAIGYLIPLIV